MVKHLLSIIVTLIAVVISIEIINNDSNKNDSNAEIVQVKLKVIDNANINNNVNCNSIVIKHVLTYCLLLDEFMFKIFLLILLS